MKRRPVHTDVVAVAPDDVSWDLPAPFVERRTVVAEEIDEYRHVNNAVYVEWLDHVAWAHSAALGLPLERCLELDRGMAVVRSTVTYAKPALLGEVVDVATWLLPTDGRLRAKRRFQVKRPADGATLARAEIEYVCLQLSTGRPVRAPAEFTARYAPLAGLPESPPL